MAVTVEIDVRRHNKKKNKKTDHVTCLTAVCCYIIATIINYNDAFVAKLISPFLMIIFHDDKIIEKKLQSVS